MTDIDKLIEEQYGTPDGGYRKSSHHCLKCKKDIPSIEATSSKHLGSQATCGGEVTIIHYKITTFKKVIPRE